MSGVDTKTSWSVDDFPAELHVYEVEGEPGLFRVAFADTGHEFGEGDIDTYIEHVGTPDERIIASIDGIGRPEDWGGGEMSSDDQASQFLAIVGSLIRKANEVHGEPDLIELDDHDPLVAAALAELGAPEGWAVAERENTVAFERIVSETQASGVGARALEASVQVSTP